MEDWERGYLACLIDMKGIVWNGTVRIVHRNRELLLKLKQRFPIFKGPYPLKNGSFQLVVNRKEDVAWLIQNAMCYSLGGKSWLTLQTSVRF